MTNRQMQVLQWIRDYMRANGWSPSVREICEGFGWVSSSSGYLHLVSLERDGFLVRGAGYRQIRLTKKGKEATL